MVPFGGLRECRATSFDQTPIGKWSSAGRLTRNAPKLSNHDCAGRFVNATPRRDNRRGALSLRLYNPRSHQWSLNFANSNGGSLSQPTIGGFKDGRGEFFDQEMLHGRAILVRFVISDITANSAHFEQSFSDDGGKTWEVNWIATDTRVKDEPEILPLATKSWQPIPDDKYSRVSLLRIVSGAPRSEQLAARMADATARSSRLCWQHVLSPCQGHSQIRAVPGAGVRDPSIGPARLSTHSSDAGHRLSIRSAHRGVPPPSPSYQCG